MADYSRPLGHSNASLFASADEMAGTYSPQTDNHDFTPTRSTPAYRVQHSGGVSLDSHPRIDTRNMELNYPMPDTAVVWHQAEHPDTIPKVLNYENDIAMETFPGAAKILSHANPEQFLMPLESRVICMKVDKLMDMKYCIANGAVTNLPSCNERIMDCWNNRDGERVFMMFSISGQKEFCALAEMISPVKPGRLPGWSKPGCDGVISITFIYVKNVPFTLINHIKHKANDQPVANMWNSMMYHDNTGYHVAKIFCEHPVLSSVLVTFRAEMRSNYKTQLRIPTSGNTQFSASSFGSQNRKLNDPRSATRVHIHRSGDRNQWANRDAAQSQSWRRNDVPPPPPRYQPQIGNTPTQVATHRRGMLQNDSKVADLPPQFSLASNHQASSAGAMHSARSFTTADDRMLAEFAESREAKRSDTGSSSSDRKTDQQAKNIRAGSNNYSGGYQDGCASRSLQRRTPPPPVNSNWRSTDMSARRGFVQWQKDGRAAQVPVFTEDSPPGLGIHSAYKNAGDQQPWRSATMLFHLPSPVTSSQPSKEGSSPQANELRRQTKQNPPAPSPSPFHGGFGQDHVRPTSKPHRTFPGRSTPRFVDSQQPLINPDNSVKHSHSMPVMVHQVTQRLSAQYLRAQAEASEPGTLGRAVKTSPSIQDWVIETPVRSAFEIEQSSSPSGNALSLVNMSAVVQEDSPEKLTAKTRHLDLEQKLKWHKARVDMLEVEIDMPGSNLKMEAVLKWQKAKVRMLQIDIIAAHKEHEVARGNLAQPTDDHPPQSPRHEHHSSEWPKRANGSSVESELIEPVVDENGKICRSASKNRLDKFTHIGQKLRHRRGTFTFANQEFSGSFDARLNANVEDLLASPTSSGRYPIPLPGHTHAHPPQGRPSTGLAHGRPEATPGHIDSCTEGKYSQEHEYCGNEAHRLNSANLTGADDDVFISSRGRGYLNRQSPSIRDPSQMSYNGGTWLGNKGESGYP